MSSTGDAAADPGRRGSVSTTAIPDHRRADLALLGVTAAWGATFPAIKVAVGVVDPFVFYPLRLGLALAGLALLFRRTLFAGLRGRWRHGVILGVLLYVSYMAQALGLEHTTASRSGFITALSVILVPFLYVPLTRRSPGLWPSLGAVVCLAGVFLLTRPDAGQLNRGDLITLICAVVYALYVVLLERYSRAGSTEPLVGIQAITVAAASLLSLPLARRWPTGADFRHPDLWAGLLVCVPVAMLTIVAITRIQPKTTATRAAVIYSAEPVFALLIAALWLGDRLDPLGAVGAGLIVGGILLAEVK